MIKEYGRFDEYAYRIATRDLDSSVATLEEGQWITLNNSGKVVVADGTKKAFIAIGSKRDGRDQVSGKSVQKVSYLHGAFELETDKYDAAGDYANAMTPLKVAAGGVLTPWVTGTDKPELIAAYSLGAPVGGFLKIVSA